MGIELDVLVGHPEHGLLFAAVQIAKASGLKNPSHAVSNARRRFKEANEDTTISLGAALGSYHAMIGDIPKADNGRAYHSVTSMMNETLVYRMLLAGKAPQSEPFRKWVTEEVLPTIRKTGSYNAETSTNPIALGIMDELKALRGELSELKLLIQSLPLSSVVDLPAVKSPYEGVTKGTVWYHKDVQAIRMCQQAAKAGETLKQGAPTSILSNSLGLLLAAFT